MKHHFTPTGMVIIKTQEITSIGEDVERWFLSYIADGNVKWCTHFGTVWPFLKMLLMDLLSDPEIPFVGITPKRKENLCPRKTLYMNGYSNIIHSS